MNCRRLMGFAPSRRRHFTTLEWDLLCITARMQRRCPLWVRSGHWGTSSECPLYPQKRTLELSLVDVANTTGGFGDIISLGLADTPPGSLKGYAGGSYSGFFEGGCPIPSGDCGPGSTFANLKAGTLTSTPLPAALPLFATGIGGLGLLGWRRKRKAQA